MSYYPVNYSASGQLRFFVKDCFDRYEETKKRLPMFNDLVHSLLKHLTFFFWLHTCRVAFWAKHMRVISQFKICTYATKGCLSSQEHGRPSAKTVVHLNLKFTTIN
jgi:hypothetical protein